MTDSPDDKDAPAHPVPFISRVRLKNYKSIAECDVHLGPLTILVGPNGSGKSNFLDALAFLRRAIATTPVEAIDEWGGLAEILRRVPGPTEAFGITVEAGMAWGRGPDERLDASYGFEIAQVSRRKPYSSEVVAESCQLRSGGRTWRFRRAHERVEFDLPDQGLAISPIAPDRLFLLSASNAPDFVPLFTGLRGMEFYNLEPDLMRPPQSPTTGEILGRAGEHLGDVLAALDTDRKRRIDAYLGAIVPGTVSIDREPAGQYVSFAMRAMFGSEGQVATFGPESMSDGTVRAAGVLAALFQPWILSRRIRLVGIEEPEIALHPAAAGVLFDALTEASERVQVLATSQSADLLDREDLDVSVIRPVTMRNGLTVIGEVDDASREIVKRKLYTLGELMRSNQLTPRPAHAGDSAPEEA